MKNYKKLESYFKELSIYDEIISILNWDMATMMPKKSRSSRISQIEVLNENKKNIFNILKKNEFFKRVNKDSLNLDQQRNFELMKKSFDYFDNIPIKTLNTISRLSFETEGLWREAREKNNFLIVKKKLHELFSQIIKNESWSGLYRGLTPTLVRDVPFSGIYLILYQNLRVYTIDYYQVKENNLPPHNSNNVKHYKNKIKDEKLPTYINFSIGFIAGSIATALTHPFDVIKTRMQVTKRFENEKISNYFKDIYTKEGSVGLSRGLFLRVIKRPLSTAMVWTVYEALKM